MKVQEFICYKIKKDQLSQFKKIKKELAAEVLALRGLISNRTLQDSSDPLCFIDVMVWNNQKDADQAQGQFAKLPAAGAFFKILAGPPLFQRRFLNSEGDK